MNKPVAYYYNRLFYQILVFFQTRWLTAFFLKFEKTKSFLLKKYNIKTRDGSKIKVSHFFSSKDYIWVMRGMELFVGIGLAPIGLYLARNIQSTSLVILAVVVIAVLPITLLDYVFLLKDNQVVKYYNLFERESPQNKRKWKIRSVVFLSLLTLVFVFNWFVFT